MGKNRKRNNPRRKRGPRAPAISRFAPIPTVMRTQLTARSYDTGSAASSPVWTRHGCLEPLGLIPQYMPVIVQMYRRARILSSTITVKLINMGTEPIELVLNTMPYNWISGSPTIAEIVGTVGAKRALISVQGGMDRASVTKRVTSKSLLGRSYALADFDFNYAQAVSPTPIDSEEPVWTFAFTALNSANSISYRAEVVITSEIEFYELYTA